MHALLRAAVAGAVVGLAESVVVDELGGSWGWGLPLVLMFLMPFPVSLLLCRWGRLPLAVPMGVTAPFCLAASLLTFVVSMPSITEYGGRLQHLVFMALGALSFAFAAAMMMRIGRGLRIATLVLVAAVHVAGGLGGGALSFVLDTRMLAHDGVPIILPDLPDHRLVQAHSQYRRVELVYEWPGGDSNLSVTVRPSRGVSQREICEGELACRKAATGLWIRDEGDVKAVITKRGRALVELRGTAPETELLALVPTLHEVGIWELAGN
ncbi:hypothetical protein HII36_31415 [Nonomuraea sp. NN258]|uniref:hypothetical protein n=1 Tax=Nonomuraea antri TaxID=2730852 RepID=UPI0015695036|nr:hypothetical protein [Nonomuraea antri]NRQ36310.1 hypothetical protein [Nonomuraea antri]